MKTVKTLTIVPPGKNDQKFGIYRKNGLAVLEWKGYPLPIQWQDYTKYFTKTANDRALFMGTPQQFNQLIKKAETARLEKLKQCIKHQDLRSGAAYLCMTVQELSRLSKQKGLSVKKQVPNKRLPSQNNRNNKTIQNRNRQIINKPVTHNTYNTHNNVQTVIVKEPEPDYSWLGIIGAGAVAVFTALACASGGSDNKYYI